MVERASSITHRCLFDRCVSCRCRPLDRAE